jgi:hypothetical protein
MRKCQILSIIILSFLSCNGQDSEAKQKTNTDAPEIIDPIIEMPYEIKNINQSVTLPEKLGGKNVQGYVFIELLINDNSEILETTIIKLSLKNKNNNKTIEYSISQGSLPSKLIRYYSFFDEYCKKKIILEKRGNPQLNNQVLITLKVE